MSRITYTLIRRAMQEVSAILFPSRCGSCERLLVPGQFWCSNCWVQFAHAIERPYCPSCAQPLGPHQTVDQKNRCPNCRKSPIPLNGICRLGVYQFPLSQSIVHFKYHSKINLGHRLGEMLGELLAEQPWIGEIDAFCPIPIHWIRRLERGFNQSQILSEQLSTIINKPSIKLLKRTRPTVRQVGLTGSARMQNIKDAFGVRKNWPVEGAVVCLVDDVMTTGSTLIEAVRTLKQAGVKKVYAAILAKAAPGDFSSV